MSGLGGEQPQSQLRSRRDELANEVAELHWNLGGLAYEMAIRDHFRLDVLLRRAAMLQERDAELAEVERMLHMQESGSAGDCPSCGAVRSRGAVFCWQCGAQVMERSATNGNGHHSTTTAQPIQASAPASASAPATAAAPAAVAAPATAVTPATATTPDTATTPAIATETGSADRVSSSQGARVESPLGDGHGIGRPVQAGS